MRTLCTSLRRPTAADFFAKIKDENIRNKTYNSGLKQLFYLSANISAYPQYRGSKFNDRLVSFYKGEVLSTYYHFR